MNSVFKDWPLLNRLKAFSPFQFFSSVEARPNVGKWTTAILAFVFCELCLIFRDSRLTPFLMLLLVLSFALLAQLHVRSLSRQILWQTFKAILSLSWKVLPLFLSVQFFVDSIFSRQLDPSKARESALSGMSLSLKPGSIESVSLMDEVSHRVQTEPKLLAPFGTYWRVGTLSVSQGLNWEGPEDLLNPTQLGCSEARQIPGKIPRQIQRQIQSKVFPADPDNPESLKQAPALSTFLPQGFFLKEQKKGSRTLTTVVCRTPPLPMRSDRLQKYLELDPAFTSPSYRMALLTKLGFSFPPLQASRHPPLDLSGNLSPDHSGHSSLKPSGQTIHLERSEFVRGLARFFQKNAFRYSVHPQALSGGPGEQLEAFLFKTQEGFCEHFAAAVATLARTAGIPSRIVLGFYNPDWNPYGEYWTLSTQNAHAWVELLGPEGWQELDPTLWAPSKGSPRKAPLSQLWDAFGFYIQSHWFNTLDWGSSLEWVGFVFLISISILISILISGVLLRKRVWGIGHFRRKSKAERDFKKLMTQLERGNLGRQDRETLERYRIRLAQTHPNETIQNTFKLYLIERFGPKKEEH